jgi:hypothetical protein
MTVVIRAGSESLEITIKERRPAGNQDAGDVRASVTVKSTGFAGHYDEVWISRRDLEDFVVALHALDRKRAGHAELVAMSPNDFTIHISAVDRAGHLAAKGWVGREYVGAKRDLRDRVCFYLELDPSVFPQLVGEIEAFGSGG